MDQSQFDELFTIAVNAACNRLESDGKLHPLGHALDREGEILEIEPAGKRPGDQAAVDELARDLHARAAAGEIAASALAQSARAAPDSSDFEGDAILVAMRAPGTAVDMIVPYALKTSGLLRKTRQVTLGEPEARQVRNNVFG